MTLPQGVPGSKGSAEARGRRPAAKPPPEAPAPAVLGAGALALPAEPEPGAGTHHPAAAKHGAGARAPTLAQVCRHGLHSQPAGTQTPTGSVPPVNSSSPTPTDDEQCPGDLPSYQPKHYCCQLTKQHLSWLMLLIPLLWVVAEVDCY